MCSILSHAPREWCKNIYLHTNFFLNKHTLQVHWCQGHPLCMCVCVCVCGGGGGEGGSPSYKPLKFLLDSKEYVGVALSLDVTAHIILGKGVMYHK